MTVFNKLILIQKLNFDTEVLEDYSSEVRDDVKKITHQVSEHFKEETKKDALREYRKKFYKHIDVKQNETLDGAVDTWYVKDHDDRLTHLIKNGQIQRVREQSLMIL